MLLNEEQAKMKEATYFCYQSGEPYKLLGFLPLISDDRKYYAMKVMGELEPSIKEDLLYKNIWKDHEKEKITHVAPVFGCLDLNFISEKEHHAKKEKDWVTNGRIPRKEKRSMSDQDIQNILKYKEENPYVLFFHGCDDGHVFIRFKNEKSAFEFLELVETFEEVFEFENVSYI